jgi:hypothetical protein
MRQVLFFALMSACLGSVAMSQTLPPDQQDFVRVVDSARNAYKSAANEMLKGVERVNRRKAICKTLNSPNVKNWVGKIVQLRSAGKDARGVLAVSIGTKITLKTWNNDFSDLDFGTLINTDSPLFASVSAMKVGDSVVFSGHFFPSEEDCVKEGSLTTGGSMNDPEFIFRFRQVELSTR